MNPQINNSILLHAVLLGGSTNVGPYWFPPSPSPASAKVPAWGQKQLNKKANVLTIFYDSIFLKKN